MSTYTIQYRWNIKRRWAGITTGSGEMAPFSRSTYAVIEHAAVASCCHRVRSGLFLNHIGFIFRLGESCSALPAPRNRSCKLACDEGLRIDFDLCARVYSVHRKTSSRLKFLSTSASGICVSNSFLMFLSDQLQIQSSLLSCSRWHTESSFRIQIDSVAHSC